MELRRSIFALSNPRNSFFRVIATVDRVKVRELESKRISDFRPRLHISSFDDIKNTGDTSASCRIFDPVRFSYFRAVARRETVENSKSEVTEDSKNLTGESEVCTEISRSD